MPGCVPELGLSSQPAATYHARIVSRAVAPPPIAARCAAHAGARAARAHVGACLAALATLAGCVYPRPTEPPAVSAAFDRPGDTTLGRQFASLLAAHPSQSGLYVLARGTDAFVARLAVIERAQQAVDLQVYIFENDLTGRAVLAGLLQAADRGVRVRLLVDDLGSAGIDEILAPADAHPNLEVRLFNPFARGPLFGLARGLDLLGHPRRLNRRMHNKLLAADGAAGIVGGRNVADEYFDAREDVNFADLDLLVVGPVVRDLGASFDLYWNSPFVVPLAAWPGLRAGPEELARLRAELAEHLRRLSDSRYADRLRGADIVRDAATGVLPLVWASTHAVADLPRKIVAEGDEVAETLLTERAKALIPPVRSELLVVSPYFVPAGKGVERLVGLARRGARVRVLTNSLAASDVAAVHSGYSSYRRDLLAGGVELHELRPSGEAIESRRRHGMFGSSEASLHAKTFVFDRRMIFVGSLNVDPRSIVLNTELGLIVESPELAGAFAEGFERMASPALSWRVALEPHGEGERLVWHGEEQGRPLALHEEPDTSWWKRFGVSLLGILPIEGQL